MKHKFKKILFSAAALLLSAGICGCSVKFGTNPKADKIDSDKIIAAATVGENIDDMSITYEEFEREYLYYLKSSRIEDDTAASVADTCKQRRETIINNLITERVILKKAREMNVDTITEEEQKQLDEQFEKEYEQQVKYLGENAAAFGYESESSGDSGETLSEEELVRIGTELFDKILAESKMSLDILREWSKNSLITQKLMEEIGKEVSRSEADEAVNKSIADAKALYESDVASYERSSFVTIYIPEGSRLIKHILLGFSDDDMKHIQSLRTDGKDGEADTFRAQKAAELADKVAEVEEKLDNGEDFMKLVSEYSADAGGTATSPDGYLAVPNGKKYMAEFQKTAFEIEEVGGRKNCVTDYGVHIMIYAADAEVDPDDITAVTDRVLQQLQQTHFNERVTDWKDNYKFQIEYDLLRIDNPDTEESSSTDSAD